MMRLLIVDDEKNIRHLYAADLKDAGYQVETAADGASAAQLLNHQDFDLVVLDIHMGNESGLDILQEIVQNRKELAGHSVQRLQLLQGGLFVLAGRRLCSQKFRHLSPAG
ncbi:MAG: response regulator [Syntrophotaleaceae bacterium]